MVSFCTAVYILAPVSMCLWSVPQAAASNQSLHLQSMIRNHGTTAQCCNRDVAAWVGRMCRCAHSLQSDMIIISIKLLSRAVISLRAVAFFPISGSWLSEGHKGLGCADCLHGMQQQSLLCHIKLSLPNLLGAESSGSII